jgi:DNA-binding phage protein
MAAVDQALKVSLGDRPRPHRHFSLAGNPEWATVQKVTHALGLRLHDASRGGQRPCGRRPPRACLYES